MAQQVTEIDQGYPITKQLDHANDYLVSLLDEYVAAIRELQAQVATLEAQTINLQSQIDSFHP